MSIFKKQDGPENRSRDRTLSAPRGSQFEATISIIGAGMKVTGDLSTEGTVRIEGQVSGTIRAGRSVVLGQSGLIEGDVFTEDAIIGGRVMGSIVATSRLELQGTSVVTGELHTRSEHLKLEEGARFEGLVHMLDGEGSESGIPEPWANRITATATSGVTLSPAVSNGQSGPATGQLIGTDENERVVFELLDDEQRAEASAPSMR